MKKTVGRPKIREDEKRHFVGIRLSESDKEAISLLGEEKGVGAGVRYLYHQFKIWHKVEKKIKVKMRGLIEAFVENFTLFVKANKSNYSNIKQIKKEVLTSAKELYFLSDLLDDDNHFLQTEIGHIHYTGLKEVWRVAKISTIAKNKHRPSKENNSQLMGNEEGYSSFYSPPSQVHRPQYIKSKKSVGLRNSERTDI